MQKAGSHVVEKCLLSSERDCIIRELVNSDKLDQLARDQYGNYVIQRAIKSSKVMFLHFFLMCLRDFLFTSYITF